MILRGVDVVGEGNGSREIVVSGTTIIRVGDRASRERPDDYPALDFEEVIAFPGLTNSHDHLEFNLYPALGHKQYADYREWGDDIHRRDEAKPPAGHHGRDDGRGRLLLRRAEIPLDGLRRCRCHFVGRSVGVSARQGTPRPREEHPALISAGFLC